MIIETKPVVTCYDVRLTLGQIHLLALFLDKYIPENAGLDKAMPGRYRQRYSDEELESLNEIRKALFLIAHG